MISRLVDRSRNIAYQRCPRSRYLGYEMGGRGIRRIRASIPLVVGSEVHEGLAELLRGRDVKSAVRVALEGYEREVRRRGLELEAGEDASFVADESRALIEGLVRAYAIKGLPRLLEQFEVLEVEQEDVWEGFAPGIGWMSRADGLLREREGGDLYVLSFKTATTWDARVNRQNQHDIQGLSEAAAIEARLPDGQRILGIKMVYLLKGRREEYPEDSGCWRTSSPLVRGWMREGITGPEYAWRYKWAGPDSWPDSGRLRGHTLGKGWTRFNSWEMEGGVERWIEMLASGEVQPDAGDPLEGVVYEPQPYYRQQRDMEDWWEQTAVQEAEIARNSRAAEDVRKTNDKTLRHALNIGFPQNRHSCDYPTACPFQPICHGGDDSALLNPFGTALFEWREPHHEAEKVRVNAKEKEGEQA